MFIDRLQKRSKLEYWSILVCKCSGETVEVEKLHFEKGQSSQPRLYRCLQAEMKNKLINLKLSKSEPIKRRQQPVHVALRKQKLKQKLKRKRDGVETL
jgi:hypothetical protein